MYFSIKARLYLPARLYFNLPSSFRLVFFNFNQSRIKVPIYRPGSRKKRTKKEEKILFYFPLSASLSLSFFPRMHPYTRNVDPQLDNDNALLYMRTRQRLDPPFLSSRIQIIIPGMRACTHLCVLYSSSLACLLARSRLFPRSSSRLAVIDRVRG